MVCPYTTARRGQRTVALVRYGRERRCTLTRSLAGKRGLFSPSQRDHRKSIF